MLRNLISPSPSNMNLSISRLVKRLLARVHHTLESIDHSWVVGSNQQSALSKMSIDRHKDGVDRCLAIMVEILGLQCSKDNHLSRIERCLEFFEILQTLLAVLIVALTGVEIDAHHLV